MADNLVLMKTIEDLLEGYKSGMTPEQSKHLMEKMDAGRFLVPVNFPQDETLAAMQEAQAKAGGPVPLPKGARPIPVLIQNAQSEQFLAIYTSPAQLRPDIKSTCVIEMPFQACMAYAKNPDNPVRGIVVNPFTDNFVMRPRETRQVTPAQFHAIARKNVEYALLPHGIYTKGKEYFDSIDGEALFRLYDDQYRDKLQNPYTADDFEVMQLGVSPKLDLIYMAMPAKKLSEGDCIRAYATWHLVAGKPGYYMVTLGAEKGSRKFVYLDEKGRAADLGEAPAESAEMQRVMELEAERYG